MYIILLLLSIGNIFAIDEIRLQKPDSQVTLKETQIDVYYPQNHPEMASLIEIALQEILKTEVAKEKLGAGEMNEMDKAHLFGLSLIKTKNTNLLAANSQKKYFIGLVDENNIGVDAWTIAQNFGNITLLIFERGKLNKLELKKRLAHEMAISMDRKAQMGMTWMRVQQDAVIAANDIWMSVVKDFYLNLSLKSLRAFKFEVDLFGHIEPSLKILDKKFKKQSCIKLVKKIRDSLIETDLFLTDHNVEWDAINEILKKDIKINGKKMNVCLYFSEYDLLDPSDSMYTIDGTGPRPRIGGTD